MDAPTEHRTLIVANLTASTPFLLQEVSRLAAERPTKFSLLVPNVDPAKAADWSLETAEKLLSRAAELAGQRIARRAGPARVHPRGDRRRRLRRRADLDAPKAAVGVAAQGPADAGLRAGIPVSVITPPEEPSPLKQFTDQFSAR